MNKESPTTLKHIENINDWNHLINNSAIIFIKSSTNLLNLHSISFQLYQDNTRLATVASKKLKYLVYVEEIQTFHDLENKLKAIRKLNYIFYIHISDIRFFEFFITADEKFVNLSANLLYSEDHCGQFKPKLLNSFNISAQKWNQKLQNFDHFSNFHGCMINFIFKFSEEFYFQDIGQYKYTNEIHRKIQLQIKNENPKYGGLLYEVVETMAKIYNFTIHYTYYMSQADEIYKFQITYTKNYGVSEWYMSEPEIDRNLD
ncbi:hypothetical protein PVAND_001540 [Polypedilum vanderplanki]|uniref:Uncharacterized protein n=1 Tax=Polypedilum vanderplanki TaxID=319348 RepID=A0A9J6BN87_POLVA|nr:hypothetical protein PVAND_001540 [Polypedilum vanderplanki]